MQGAWGAEEFLVQQEAARQETARQAALLRESVRLDTQSDYLKLLIAEKRQLITFLLLIQQQLSLNSFGVFDDESNQNLNNLKLFIRNFLTQEQQKLFDLTRTIDSIDQRMDQVDLALDVQY